MGRSFAHRSGGVEQRAISVFTSACESLPMERRTVDLNGKVHYLDFGGSGRPIVLVHGLGGSSVNWIGVGKQLTAHGRVLALDLAGHGRTRSLGRSARVSANRVLLARFLDAVARAPAVLIGNSMGGYLSLAQAAAEPPTVRALVLVAPAVPRPPGKSLDPRVAALFAGLMMPFVAGLLMRRRARRGHEQSVRDLLKLCTVDMARVAPEFLEAHVALAQERAGYGNGAHRDFIAAARSLVTVLMRRGRYLEMVRRVRAPTLIVNGKRDRLVRLSAALALAAERPDWQIEVLDDVGHVPQLERPEQFLAVVEPWLRSHAD
jgi:pimeloyl-ACP methyl ester carboxylesterase